MKTTVSQDVLHIDKDVQLIDYTMVGNHSLKAVNLFCYLVGMCVIAKTVHIRSAWKAFRDLLPILTSKSISIKTSF